MNISKPKQVCLGLVVTRLAAAWVVCCLGARNANACGLDWSLPTNHFDGVDEQGHVSYWENIGEVDCGDGLVLPLHINFNSKRDTGTPSPYLGQGWILPLLECKIIQESEDRFVMIQPDGLSNLFLRAGPNGTVLNGSAGWKGEIKGNTVTAWASCGWRITFTNGRIASMTTPKGRQLDWVYEGGKASELREGGIGRLKVEYGVDGKAQAIGLPNGRRILLTQGNRPRVQTAAGQSVMTGVDRSLVGLTLADGQKRTYEFGTDEHMLSTLRVGNEVGVKKDGFVEEKIQPRLLAWNPQILLAARDDAWDYQITPAAQAGDNAAIERTNAKGQKEYWFNDIRGSKETTLGSDGVQRTVYWFTSGALAGKPRKIEELVDGKVRVVYQAAYDELGRLIRETNEKGFVKLFNYGADGKIASQQTVPPNDSDAIQRFKDKEAVLLAAVTRVAAEKLRDEALLKLGLFYAENQDMSQALSLISKIHQPEMVFNLKFGALLANGNQTVSEKAAELRRLQQQYPQDKEMLAAMIAGFDKESTNPASNEVTP